MRVHIGLVFVILTSLLISCASLPPEKDFETELWFLNNDMSPMTISRFDDDDVEIFYDIKNLDPAIWIMVKLEHIKDEWKFEKLLIKSCREWR